ncbi:MAG: leucine-rich repeat domain-containing protein, partial [Clostridia bacterium]|nr:leucine-rich repeat domain-containing protein [Clostridia bacterium]
YGYKGKNSEIEIPYKFEKGFVEKFSLHKKVDTQVSEYLNKITKVVIQEGVKEILSKGFYCCDSLEFVQIPESVEIIGDRAFVNDKNLVSLKVPSSVKYIGEYAFANCDNLTLEVEKNSYAEKYAIDNEIKYIIY